MVEKPTLPTNADERRERQAAVDFALASVRLEGFIAHPDDEELSRRYVAGEITIRDAIEAVHASARTPLAITDAERRKRQAAADFARSSLRLEGFSPSEEAEARMRRFIDGEIGLDEAVKPSR